MNRLRLLAAAFSLLASGVLVALPADRAVTQYVRRAWTVEQGLPHGIVRGVAQTGDGYLWLATYEGLVRFNGDSFRVFDQSGDPNLPSNGILTLCRTKDDTLWLGTLAGLTRYNSGRFEAIPAVKEIVLSVASAPDGSVWAGTSGGNLFHVSGTRVDAIKLPFRSNPINALAATKHGVWIGTSSGLVHYVAGSFSSVTAHEGLSNDNIVALLASGEDDLYIGTASGVDHLTGGNAIAKVTGLPSDQVTALHRDHDGNLWIGTYSHGLFRLRDRQVSAYSITDGLLNPTVRSIFEDDEGSLWVGTNGGIEQLRGGAFVTWNRHDGLDDDFARAVFEDRDGVMWVGTANGLNRYAGGKWWRVDDHRLEGILAIAQSRDGTRWYGTSKGLYKIQDGRTTLITSDQGLSNDTIRAIHEDRHGDVWIATNFGLNRIHPDGRIESFAGDSAGGNGLGLAIAEGRDGRIWIATDGGLAEFDGTKFRLHTAPRELPTNRLLGLEADDDGTIWIATDSHGLIRYRDGKARSITTREGLANDKLLSIVDDKQGNLWFGTVRGAFFVAKRDLNAVADGRRPRLPQIQVFDEGDGLGSRQCNGAASPSALRTHDGRIWFATAKGISASASSRPLPLPLRAPVIERISINGKDVAPSALQSISPGAERIEFEFSGLALAMPERLHFRYRVEGYDAHWTDAGRNRVATYTNLPAGDDRFVLESSRDGVTWRGTSLSFRLLPHFYQTKWFLALSVIGIAAILLALHSMRLHFTHERARLLEKVVEERTHQIREEKARTEQALQRAEAATLEAERHERMVEEALARAEDASHAKSTFLAATSHELRTPLNAIIGFSDILLEQTDPKSNPRHARFLSNIHSSGQHLLAIINNILDLSKVEAGRMEIHPETIVLQEVVLGICAVMKGVTTLHKITIETDIPQDLPMIEADLTLVKQILYNLMSNAVKFSPQHATVLVSARLVGAADSALKEDAVEIRVVDQGTGIDPKDHDLIFQEFRQAQGPRGERPHGTGLGLALVRRFVELHRGTIRVQSEPGKGSTFITLLPCSQQSAALTEQVFRDEPMAKV